MATFCSDGTRFPQGNCDGDGNCVSSTEMPCEPYQCDGDACATTCANDDDCVDGFYCDQDNHCVAVEPDGQPCDTGAQCASGFCVDAVCCETACDGACEACNQSGDGTCTTVADGATCGSGDICCNGACCDGCCGADGSCGACLVFVTSNVSQANLGGLAGADLAFQTLAELATPSPLPGEYTAWLSIDDGPDQSPASGRFRHSGQPYRLVNGTQIAANWADLTAGNLAAPISLTESGQGVSSATRSVWTNTRTDGTAGGHFGQGWLSSGGWQLTSGSSGNNGDATATGVGWTFIGNGSCNRGNLRLYCFQQR